MENGNFCHTYDLTVLDNMYLVERGKSRPGRMKRLQANINDTVD